MPFFSGWLLGLAMILPIGPQNVYVLSNGLLGGLRRGLLAAFVAGVCDTVLILAGAAGLSALLAGLPWLRAVLLYFGAAFLIYLGISGWRKAAGEPAETAVAAGNGGAAAEAAAGQPSAPSDGGRGDSPLKLVAGGIAVSWGNPHAILDTVAVLGSAIAAYDLSSRTAFAAGTVSASWTFFLFLALVGALFRSRLTQQVETWVSRISGAIMLLFAVLLVREAFLG